MQKESQIIEHVAAVYQWIDQQLVQIGQGCKGCGDCCDFESFGHRLYVTTPELVYFQQHMPAPIKTMSQGVCPYRVDGRCSVYPYRFSGCRIFSCKGDPEKENPLCEQAIGKFKSLCDEYELDYHYVNLQKGLEMLTSGLEPKTKH